MLVSLPYAIVKKNKILTSVSLTTLIWWGIWWIIGSAILWYGTVLVSRTMITVWLFLDGLLKKDKSGWKLTILSWIFMLLLVVFFWIQIIYNFMRIASQWANSAFVRYKGSVGNVQLFDKTLQVENKVKYWYWWKDIFDLQFPQYNPIINALADRNNEDWVIVAWTYSQYFLWNQWNIKWDWMLSDFWVESSDWDLCKTYWRLRNSKTRYLIVDPNIGSVTMWEWNESLFYRFFGKLNSDKSEIEIDGTVTTLIRLAKWWYLKLLSTNNIWAKYAFVVDDDMIRQYFWENLTDEQLILTRAKMAVLKYFYGEADSIFWSVADMFMTRIMYDMPSWIQDIADVYWMEIDNDKVANAAYNYLSWRGIEWLVDELTQNERAVLINYINIYGTYAENPNNIWPLLQNLLLNSVSWSSQVIALELQ